MSTTAAIIAFLDALHALPVDLRPSPVTTWLGCTEDIEPVLRAWVAAHEDYEIDVGAAGNVEVIDRKSLASLVTYYRRVAVKEAA